jgi:hypothetical protein
MPWARARQVPYPVTARRPLAAPRAAACAELTLGAVAGEPQVSLSMCVRHLFTTSPPAPTLAELMPQSAKMRDKAVSDALAAQFGKP